MFGTIASDCPFDFIDALIFESSKKRSFVALDVFDLHAGSIVDTLTQRGCEAPMDISILSMSYMPIKPPNRKPNQESLSKGVGLSL